MNICTLWIGAQMIQINVADNVDRVLAEMASIPERMRTRAITDALRRTAQQTKTVVIRAVTREYAVQRSRVESVIHIIPNFASAARLSVVIDAIPSQSGKRSANVIRFLESRVSLAQHRKRMKAGDHELHFKFRKTASTKVIRGAFVGNSGRTIFRRTGQSRLPIESVMVIDVPQMFTARKINAQGVEFIRRRFPELMRAEAQQEIKRLR